MAEWVLGVLGGSGVYDIDGLEKVERRRIEGPWGAPSDELLCGEVGGVRLVFLPLEPHHYGAEESLQHMLWEMNRWLDIYVKPAKAVGGAE